MHLLKKRSTRFYLGFLIVLALTVGGSAMAAFADSGTGATVAVSGGSLSETAPTAVAATAVALTGDDQTTNYSLPLSVNDPRGNGAGWNMTISATQFTGTNSNSNTLPSTAQYISSAPTAVCASNSGNGHCTAPTNSVSYTSPLTITTTAQKFYDAAVSSGLGKFTVTTVVNISIPANTYADTYASTVSVAIVSGP
jgi:hypothetical protein